MKECIHCNYPNPEGWFYCKSCGKKVSESVFTTNMYMRTAIGKRTDIEFSSQSMDKSIDSSIKNRQKSNNNFWQKKNKDYLKKKSLRYG